MFYKDKTLKDIYKKIFLKKIDLSELLIMLPFYLVTFIVPFIIKFNIILLSDEQLSVIAHKLAQNDYFTYYKSKIIILIAILCLVNLMLFRKQYKAKFKRIYMMLAFSYATFTSFSIIFSAHKEVALWGVIRQSEGGIVVISYVVIFVYVLRFCNRSRVQRISKVLILSAFLMGVIGILEYFNIFILELPIFRPLIYGYYNHSYPIINITSKMHMTIGTYNVVGEYMALFIVLLFGFLYNNYPYGRKQLIFTYITYYLLCFSWVLCGSRGGLLGGIIGIIVNILLCRRKLLIDFKKNIVLILTTFLLIVVLLPYAESDFSTRMENEKMSFIYGDTEVWLKDIKGVNGHLTLKMKEGILTIDNMDSGYKISFNGLDIPCEITKKEKNKELFTYKSKEKISGESLILHKEKNIYDKLILILDYKGLEIALNENLEIVNWKGNLINYRDIPHIETGNYGKVLSGRVYLWSRIIPIIENHPIFGIGPNCLIYEYPQYDIIGQMRYLGSNTNYLTLCHNYFIQIAVSQGIPALIVYLALLGFFFFYHRPRKGGDDAYLFYCFASANLGYLISTLVMDSSVCVAPIAWICLGMGIVIKEMNYLAERT